jgi:purine-cytosine permease-like protein
MRLVLVRFFGVRGRVVGSFLSLLTAIAFYSISVWVSGDAIVGALTRMFNIEKNALVSSIIYAVIGFIVIVVVVSWLPVHVTG